MQTIERLDLQDAWRLIEGARAEAEKIGVAMCIAVTDESGFLIAFERMAGGKPLSTTLAQDKAFTAAISMRSTAFYNERAVDGSLLNGISGSVGGRFTTVGGGVPVEHDGKLVGAIGISGGAPEQDIQCCEAGIAHWRAGR